jgi:hypothetical protein
MDKINSLRKEIMKNKRIGGINTMEVFKITKISLTIRNKQPNTYLHSLKGKMGVPLGRTINLLTKFISHMEICKICQKESKIL